MRRPANSRNLITVPLAPLKITPRRSLVQIAITAITFFPLFSIQSNSIEEPLSIIKSNKPNQSNNNVNAHTLEKLHPTFDVSFRSQKLDVF